MTNTYEKVDKTWSELKTKLQFPVEAYLKENGFLGIVSYNPKTDDLFIASKSTNEGDHAGYFKELLLKQLGDKTSKFTEFLKRMESSAIFEVIDIVNDPHIIKYNESKVVLLDVVKNDFENDFMDYHSLELFAKEFNFEIKLLFKTLNTFDELKEFIDLYNDSLTGVPIEGFVFKDSKGFMFKYKTPYYNFWKIIRGLKDKIVAGRKLPSNLSESQLSIIRYMKTIDIETLSKMSIIDVRERYYQKDVDNA